MMTFIEKIINQMKPYLFLSFFILLSICCWGQGENIDTISRVSTENTLQEDSIFTSKSSTSVAKVRTHSPKLAGCLSAVVPGLGQAYNKKYWKIPIDYAGFAATGYFVYSFHSQYVAYRDEYRNRLNKKTELLNPDWAGYDNANIIMNRQAHQKNMQISIMVMAAWYFINILDAVVDAHLMTFDVSNNLALQISPDFKPNLTYASKTVGVNFTLNLK